MSRTPGTEAHIYSLKDPQSGEVRYVGRAENPHKRLRAHLVASLTSHQPKYRWMRGLAQDGRMPILVILEVVAIEDAKDRERYWIQRLSNSGAKLSNVKFAPRPPRPVLPKRKRGRPTTGRTPFSSTSFRLTQQECEMIARLAKKLGITKIAVMRRALRELAQHEGVE